MKSKLIILLLLCTLLSGCGNYRELNQIAIITGIGIDKKDDKYEVSVLIANAQKSETSSKEGESQPTVYSGTGKSLVEATKVVERKTPKQLYLGHINVVLISEEIAEDGFLKVADWLLRNPESRKKFYLILAKDSSAKDVLEIVSPLESFPSQNIATLMGANSKTQSITNSVTYSDFIKAILTEGEEGILPSIKIMGKENKGDSKDNLDQTNPNTYLELEAIAIFKDDKFMGYTTNNESQAINILKNTVKQSVFTINYDNGEANITTKNISSNIKIKDTDKFNITINGEARLAEINSEINLNDKKVIKDLENKLNKKIENQITKVIKTMQEKYKSDIFGFGNLVYQNYPKSFKDIEDKWNDVYFPKIKVNVKSNVQLISTGSIENTIGEEESK